MPSPHPYPTLTPTLPLPLPHNLPLRPLHGGGYRRRLTLPFLQEAQEDAGGAAGLRQRGRTHTRQIDTLRDTLREAICTRPRACACLVPARERTTRQRSLQRMWLWRRGAARRLRVWRRRRWIRRRLHARRGWWRGRTQCERTEPTRGDAAIWFVCTTVNVCGAEGQACATAALSRCRRLHVVSQPCALSCTGCV